MGSNKAFTLLMAAMTVVPGFGASRIAPPMLAEGGFADIVERTLPSVVRVVASRGKAAGEGSGVVISRDGYLLTNHHVVDGATSITVHLSDDRELSATLIAADPPTDIAVLKVEAAGLPAISFGDSSRVRIGDYALAIGNPFGVGTTVTLGIVSAKGEGDYLQTDAAINPGNSGGPLLNIAGDLIGINTAIVSPSGGSAGVGLALPSNLARFVMTELITKGRVERGYLGVGLQPMNEALGEALGVKRGSALISDVAPQSPAARAGLQKGDVVVAMNGRVLRDFGRLRLFIAQAQPGAAVELTIARKDGETVVPVKLEQRPDSAAASLGPQEVLAGVAVNDSLVVAAIDPQGASASTGLLPGDQIVAVDRKAVEGVEGLRRHLASETGKPVLLEISRGGATYFVAVPRQ